MPRLEIPLIGLLEEALLPGEERTFSPPAVDPVTLGVLSQGGPERLCALCIASRVELPSLIGQRWGTEARVVFASKEQVTLKGERRLKVLSAHGKESPYTAEVLPEGDPESGETPLSADREWQEISRGGHMLFAALSLGATPEEPWGHEAVKAALAALLRALSTPDELREAVKRPFPEALKTVATALAKRRGVQEASCALEASLREIAQKPDLPKAIRHRLWAQVVEIQKKLDVYDPLSATEEGSELQKLQKKLEQAGLPKAARQVAKRQLRLLRGMSTSHHDYPTFLGHLQFMARLPWHPEPPRPLSLDAVEAILSRDHAGLERPKRRILEYLAVRSLGGTVRGTVLCFVGPPGVGKTSLARAIAEALGRPFVRVALGGVHDESEIRGNRLTFVAASPGRLLNGIARAGSASAVMLLDEIDKIGTDRQRSPAAALLEVLDPEQNTHFYDNYLGVPYDLSGIFFLCTANDLSTVSEPLKDRLEVIELEGYTIREKAEIARRHILPRLSTEHGLSETLSLEEDALTFLIEGYTREAGVRHLTRCLASIHRARALAQVRGVGSGPRATDDGGKVGVEEAEGRGKSAEDAPNGSPEADTSESSVCSSPLALSPSPTSRASSIVTAEEVQEVLGPPKYTVNTLPETLPVGMATGLSVGAFGGSVIFIEVGKISGREELILTGRLGEVLRESAQTALSHLKLNPSRYGLTQSDLACGFHVHFPEAATAKDGPSAGVALFLAFLSALTGRALPAKTAMTGELTLNGSVLAVGGVRAKLLAAERAGVERVFLPEANSCDIPSDLKVKVSLVREISELVEGCFPVKTSSRASSSAPKKTRGARAKGADGRALRESPGAEKP